MAVKEKAPKRPPVRAGVAKVDWRRGTASIVVSETGRSFRIPWKVLKHAPVLAPGLEVVITLDEDGAPTG